MGKATILVFLLILLLVPHAVAADAEEKPPDLERMTTRELIELGVALKRQVGPSEYEQVNGISIGNVSYWLEKKGPEALPQLIEAWSQGIDFVEYPIVNNGKQALPFLHEIIKIGPKERIAPTIELIRGHRIADESSIPFILPYLSSLDEDLSRDVVSTLTGIGSAAVPPLIELLGDKQHRTRLRASSALREQKAAAEPAVPALIKLLDDEFDDVRECAISALGAIGKGAAPAIDRLTVVLYGKDRSESYWASTALGKIGPAALERLMDDYFLSDAEHRIVIVKSMEKFKQTDCAFLAVALEDLDPEVRRQAASFGAWSQGSGEELLLDVFLRAASDPEPEVRCFAAGMIGMAVDKGARDPGALYVLLALAGDPQPGVRGRAIESLVSFPGEVEVTLPVIRKALRPDTPDFHYSAIRALTQLGDKGRAAIPELMAVANDSENFQRLNAIKAMVKMGETRSVAVALAQCLEKNYYNGGSEIFNMLGEMGDDAAPAIPVIGRLLKENKIRPNPWITEFLKKLGPCTNQIQPVLIELIEANLEQYGSGKIDWPSRDLLWMLGAIHTDEDAVAPILIEIIENGPDELKHDAITMSGLCGKRGEKYLPLLWERSQQTVGCGWMYEETYQEPYARFGDAAVEFLWNKVKEEPERRFTACTLLIYLKQDNPRLARLLREEIEAENPDTEPYRIHLLAGLESERDLNMKAIAGLIDAEDKRLRDSALYRLAENPDLATDYKERILELLGPDGAGLNGSLAKAIEALGPAAAEAEPTLLRLLESENWYSRRLAVYALGDIGASSVETVSAIEQLLADEDHRLVMAAASVLLDMGYQPEVPIEPFTERLGGIKSGVDQEVIEFLGRLGPDAREALPELKRMYVRNRSSNLWSEWLADAILNIDPGWDPVEDGRERFLARLEDYRGRSRAASIHK